MIKLVFAFFVVSVTGWAFTPEDSVAYTHKLFERVSGVPIMKADARFETMKSLIEAGKLKDAVKVATEDAAFLRVTVKDFAAVMGNQTGTPIVDLNDFQALFMGVIRDRSDARLLLTANFRYEGDPSLGLTPVVPGNNTHFTQLEARRPDYRTALKKKEPQWNTISESAGLLTTRGWGEAHYNAGTNRRAVEYAFKEFLCTPKEKWKDPGLPDIRVRRDVPRNPEGDPKLYQMECRSCHAPMDGLGGAFASFDFAVNTLVHYGSFGVAPKMNVNGDVFPNGYKTGDNTWFNLLTRNHNESFGWRGDLEGVGVKEFGAMLSNSKGFSGCMVQKVFRKVCRRELTELEKKDFLEKMLDRFETSGYDLRGLFEEIAIQPNCLGTVNS